MNVLVSRNANTDMVAEYALMPAALVGMLTAAFGSVFAGPQGAKGMDLRWQENGWEGRCCY